MDSNLKNILKQTAIVCSNMDDLVAEGIENILENGIRVSAKSKHCLQAYNVSYALTNPLDRVLTLRRPYSVRYLSRELLAFFKGSLKVYDGLSHASKFWEKIADKNGEINSNYGHYVFHIQLPEANNQTQYDWVVSCFHEDLDTRQALVNISQINHKTRDVLDFPCTLGLQFYVIEQHFCCEVTSRSTDVIWGLPYDMGFFSFLTELLYKDVKRTLPKGKESLKLGYVRMNTCFTQIYDTTKEKAKDVLDQLNSSGRDASIQMPEIECVDETIRDIYNGTQKTKVMKWINSNA